jgi:hypothetical protein
MSPFTQTHASPILGDRFMRRILVPLLLLLLLPISATPQTPANAAPPSAESAQLRATAQKLLATGSTEDTLKAADLLDKASQIDARNAEILKTNLERQKLEQTSPAWKSFVNDVGPFITILVLAGTFIFNLIQAGINENHKREDEKRQRADKLQDIARQDIADAKKHDADELKRYTDAAELIGQDEGISPAATLIRTFTTEPYRSEARQLGRDILLKTKSYDRFQDLFRTVSEPVTQDNLVQVIGLLRKVHENVGPLLTLYNESKDPTRLPAEQLADYKLLVSERTFLSVSVAAVLRQARDPATPLDLSDLGFDICDLTGADLRNATIANASWNRVNLDGADLRGIADFQNCWFYNTAWWHASHIDKPLLRFLAEKFPFAEDQFPSSPQPISQKDYDENLARLQALAG